MQEYVFTIVVLDLLAGGGGLVSIFSSVGGM
jgi:hypothetical protein